jgi:hypothetical protein
MKISNNDDGDPFWSLAMNDDRLSVALPQKDDDDDDDYQTQQSNLRTITTQPPAPDLSPPLVLRLAQNYEDGCFSDVSGDIWDASLLLSTFLYGTNLGRRLCHEACFDGLADYSNADSDEGGILELGSGLGLSGMAAAAAAVATGAPDELHKGRIVMTDLNDKSILALLRKNVTSNLCELERRCSITVEPCDWTHVAKLKENASSCPRGTFNLIIGSALVYIPNHAAACADTIAHYLCHKPSSQAVIVQLPDRAGFDSFLYRCHELDLSVTSRVVDKEVILKVEESIGRKLVAASDYRIYFITWKIA